MPAASSPASKNTAAPVSGAYTKAKQIGNKSVAVITGASSGLGLATAKKLADTGTYQTLQRRDVCCFNALTKASSAKCKLALPGELGVTLGF